MLDLLLTMLVVVVIVGAIFYVINYVIPLPPVFKIVANVILGVFILIWLIYALGGSGIRLGRWS